MATGVLDLSAEAVEIGSAAVAGGLQRAAWERSMPAGFMATGIALIGGMFLEQNATGAMRGFAHSMKLAGAAVGGWVIAEKFMERVGHDMAGAQDVRMLAPGMREETLTPRRQRETQTVRF